MVLNFLRENKLYSNLGDCIFYQNKIHYLEHIISTEGITMDCEKIEAIRGWKMSRNLT
jgi:hypothetical protein